MKNTILFLAVLLATQLSAQNFTNYTTTDGLIDNSVNCLAIDANDQLWFGTQEGISFFDGNTFVNYDVNSHPDLVSNTITALAVDKDNNLWIGTDFGVNKFDGSSWTTYKEADGLADDRVKYITEGPDGRIWFANNDGISILDGTTWVSYTMTDGLPFGGTNYVSFDSDGIAYLGSPLGGVLIFDGTTFTSLKEADGLLSNKVRSIAIRPNNEKWIGTADGISVFTADNEFVTHHELIFQLPPPDELNPVEDLQIDSDGRVWVGVYVDYLVTEGGISLYDGGAWQDFDRDDGLVGPVVRRLAIDSKDNVWVVTSTGISKIEALPTSVYELSVDQDILLFPNPAQNHLQLQVPTHLLNHSYELFDSQGRMLRKKNIQQEQTEIELQGLAPGFYSLRIGGLYHRKLIRGFK